MRICVACPVSLPNPTSLLEVHSSALGMISTKRDLYVIVFTQTTDYVSKWSWVWFSWAHCNSTVCLEVSGVCNVLPTQSHGDQDKDRISKETLFFSLECWSLRRLEETDCKSDTAWLQVSFRRSTWLTGERRGHGINVPSCICVAGVEILSKPVTKVSQISFSEWT